MLVPGVSGGTMAMLLGIYDRLIYAVSSFRKDIKGNIFFLWMFLLGGLAGMFLFSRPILYLIENFPKPSLFFFLGAVVGGVPMIVRHSSVQKLTFRVAAYVLIGIVIVFLISKLPPDLFSAGDGGSVSPVSLVDGCRRFVGCGSGTAGNQRILYAAHAGSL